MNIRYQTRKNRSHRGFTLVEMLVVIAIMVLAMTLAVPAIRSLTGSRSIDAAENKVASYIANTRTEAIGLQRIEGVLFYLDTLSDRVGCIAVAETPRQGGDISGVVYLDLIDDRDPVSLPTGIRLWTIKDTVPQSLAGAFTEPLPNSRYLGFNSYGTAMNSNVSSLTSIPGGVILFDGHTGRLTAQFYGFRFAQKASGSVPPSAISKLLNSMNNQVDNTGFQNWPPPASAPPSPVAISQVGLVLFDRETFASQSFIVPGSADQNDVTGGATQQAINAWLDQNTTPVFVNRYDGTLMRAE